MLLYQKIRSITFRLFPWLERKYLIKQFTKFCIIGLTNVAVDFIVYFILTRVIFLYFILANILSFSVAVTWSFYWNKKWTFRGLSIGTKNQYIKFFSINFFGVVVQTLFLYVLVVKFNLHDIFAKSVAIIIAAFWNFILSKFWAFQPSRKKFF